MRRRNCSGPKRRSGWRKRRGGRTRWRFKRGGRNTTAFTSQARRLRVRRRETVYTHRNSVVLFGTKEVGRNRRDRAGYVLASNSPPGLMVHPFLPDYYVVNVLIMVGFGTGLSGRFLIGCVAFSEVISHEENSRQEDETEPPHSSVVQT